MTLYKVMRDKAEKDVKDMEIPENDITILEEIYTTDNNNIVKALWKDDVYAVKFIRRYANFQKEAKFMQKKIDHPNIVKYHGYFFSETALMWGIVMDYIDGEALIDYALRTPNKRIPEEEMLEYIPDMFSAIKCLHDNGITHRDIKADNFILTDCMVPILIDFDRITTNAVSKSTDGTVCYYAPEVSAGLLYDKSIDYWCFGMTVFVLTHGYFPFKCLPNKPPPEAAYKSLRKETKIISEKLLDLVCGLVTEPLLRYGEFEIIDAIRELTSADTEGCKMIVSE